MSKCTVCAMSNRSTAHVKMHLQVMMANAPACDAAYEIAMDIATPGAVL
jgi:hypothetical protein